MWCFLDDDILDTPHLSLHICVKYNHAFLVSIWPVGLLKISFFLSSPSLSFILMPPAQCLLLCFGVMSVSLCVYVWMEICITGSFRRKGWSGGRGWLRIMSSVSCCCDEVFLRNAKLGSLNELTSSEGGIQFDAAPESSSYLQVRQTSDTHSLRCASQHRDYKQYNPRVMFAELCPYLHSIQAVKFLIRHYFNSHAKLIRYK